MRHLTWTTSNECTSSSTTRGVVNVPREILDGKPGGRRTAYFSDMGDVQANQPALEEVVLALETGAAPT
jgi:hypothetical protein